MQHEALFKGGQVQPEAIVAASAGVGVGVSVRAGIHAGAGAGAGAGVLAAEMPAAEMPAAESAGMPVAMFDKAAANGSIKAQAACFSVAPAEASGAASMGVRASAGLHAEVGSEMFAAEFAGQRFESCAGEPSADAAEAAEAFVAAQGGPRRDHPRELPLRRVRNVRDLGGYAYMAEDGTRGTTAYGLLLRAPSLRSLRQDGFAYLADYGCGGLRRVVDLRSDFEVRHWPDPYAGGRDGVAYTHVPMLDQLNSGGFREALPDRMFTVYKSLLDNEGASIRRVLEALAGVVVVGSAGALGAGCAEVSGAGSAERSSAGCAEVLGAGLADASGVGCAEAQGAGSSGAPSVGSAGTPGAPGVGCALFHCRAGKDRTGVIAMLLLGLAGVADEDIVRDYAATQRFLGRGLRAQRIAVSVLLRRRAPRCLFEAIPEEMELTLAHLHECYGSARAYLREVAGCSEELLACLTARLRGRGEGAPLLA